MQTQQLTRVSIRPFTADDYPVIAHLQSVNFPEFGMDADEWRFEDAGRPAHCQSARWVAECDGRVVAFAYYDQSAHFYHPRKFEIDVVVDPAFFLRGIGRRLYELVLAEVRGLDPLSASAWSRADMAYRVGFLERRGFVPDMRMWTSVLDLATFDPGRFTHVATAVEAQGIELRTLAELGANDQGVWRKLYDLWREVRLDVPHPPSDAPVDVSWERFFERNYDRPYLLPEGYFVAVDGDEYVGTSHLWRAPEPSLLRTGMTGVRRAYRRRGIAFALKVRSLEFATAHGYASVQTENELNNQGMLAINDQLGFARNPAWVHYLKSIQG